MEAFFQTSDSRTGASTDAEVAGMLLEEMKGKIDVLLTIYDGSLRKPSMHEGGNKWAVNHPF